MAKDHSTISLLISVVALGVSIVSAIFTLWYTSRNERRAGALFAAQVRPLVQQLPTTLTFDPSGAWGTATVEVVNYSGFDARSVTLDLQFGKNAWIVQWLEAHAQHLQRLDHRTPEEETRLRLLAERPWRIDPLGAGEGITRSLTFSLSRDYVCKERDGVPVQTRIKWKSERGYTFDRVRKLRLLCTTVETGTTFDFLPHSIVADDE